MIDLLEQIEYAQRVMSKLYGENLPLSAKPKPLIPFPDGWRIPYSLYHETPTGSFRLRHTMLILFFRKNAINKPSVEWDELSERSEAGEGQTRLDTLKSFSKSPSWQFESLTDVLKKAPKKEPAADQIETVEMVLDDPTGKWQPCWRLGIKKTDSTHCVIRIPPDGESTVEPAKRAQASVPPWQLYPARRFNKGSLTLRLGEEPELALRRAQLTTWTCFLQVEGFFRKLDYGEPDLHGISVQYAPSVQHGCCAELVDGVPTITMGYKNGWGEAPDIFLHELGHALWYLFYTRLPRGLDKNSAPSQKWIDGVQEGFADYFAAAILNDGQPIGAYLPKDVRDKEDLLPRALTTEYHRPEDGEDEPHKIGDQWANVLWNLRMHLLGKQIEPHKIDQLVLNAHLQPQQDELSPSNAIDPFACYLESVHQTAGVMGIDLKDWQMEV